MKRILSALPAIAILLSVAMPAQAQVENRALFDRIDRLERDIQVLNQNLARGGSGGASVIRSPAVEPQPIPPGMASRLDVRVDALEDQIRQLIGKVEESNFRAQQALKQIERMQADIDLRFQDLQKGPAAGQAPGSAATPALTAPGPSQAGGNAAEAAGGAPGPQVLGTMPEKDLKRALAQQPAATAPSPKDPQGMYDVAYAAAQRGDYGAAEAGFKSFLDSHPDHQLSGNASYWMGDIAFVKKDFTTAAATFLEAYKRYPKHSKAPDMIFKAGAAFGHLGKKKEACTALGILFKDHPNMPDRVKRAATAERTKNECK